MEQLLNELLQSPTIREGELRALARAINSVTVQGVKRGVPVRVEQLAAELCTSERNLRRKCDKWFGMSPSALLTAIRMQQAKALLRQGLSIGEVAYQLGFTTHSHFSNVFKRQVGSSPSQFQQQALA